MDCSTSGFPVLHYLQEFSQIHIHWVSDAIQPSHLLSSPSPPSPNPSQHQSFPMSQLFAFQCKSLWKVSSCSCCCSVANQCPTLCDPMDSSTLGFPVLHYLPELAQLHIHWVSDAIQPSHPLSPSSPPAFSLSQHQGLFQWAGSSCQVAQVLELQFQYQFFQWLFRVDFL